jgi:hypothetical protein
MIKSIKRKLKRKLKLKLKLKKYILTATLIFTTWQSFPPVDILLNNYGQLQRQLISPFWQLSPPIKNLLKKHGQPQEPLETTVGKPISARCPNPRHRLDKLPAKAAQHRQPSMARRHPNSGSCRQLHPRHKRTS